MRSRSARLAATAAAVAMLGTLAAAAPAVAAPGDNAPPRAASEQHAAGYSFKDWYRTKAACNDAGAYYVRHGYSDYYCELYAYGWALMLKD
ncbi:hypothetical protein ACQEU8_28345 [Streptomyces sp. CA-250714]|uniref:hypothetical protein n=1 Tax=Streptomyces sp. CA-250714 TaxID=3240060 RepID=UPI003D8DD671